MLSDACSDFMQMLAREARKLADEAHRYAAPDYAIAYGPEIDALRRSCLQVADDPHNIDAARELVRLVEMIRRYYDTPPDTIESHQRQSDMLRLVALFSEHAALRREDAEKLSKSVGQEGEAGEKAATELRGILSRLGKPAYDAATKIIADIGSATVKHFLGL